MGRVAQWALELLDNGDIASRRMLAEANWSESLRCENESLNAVADYVELGFTIVPQQSGEKKPAVMWKRYQSEPPSLIELLNWFLQWPDAGPALVLGTFFAIDVDGTDAHHELLNRLGELPRAPMSLSGSGKPDRYHLLFRAPDFPTRAKATPWHPSLEFRGRGGIIVLPPARHASGRRYEWASGRSPMQMPIPDLPEAVLAALQQAARRKPALPPRQNAPASAVAMIHGLSHNTQQFLTGKFADCPGWNSRLFAAACDLAGNRISKEIALAALLAGARPWTEDEISRVTATTESAYSEARAPARTYAPPQGVWRGPRRRRVV